MKRTSRLRELMARGEPIWVPVVYDTITAKIVEAVGFEALFVSGSNVSVGFAGLPDVGLTTMTEVMTVSRNIVNATTIPVLVDSDTGWGNAINVRRTVQEFVRAGVAGILLEDQVAPKRCGWVAGKQVIPFEEAVGKYRAAADAKNELDPDFVICARTDVRGAVGGDFEQAIQRGQAYVEAGADMVFLEALQSVEEVERAAREVPGPKWFNYFRTAPMPVSRVKELGYTLIVTGHLQGPFSRAAWDFAVALKEDGVAALNAYEGSMKGHALEDHHAWDGLTEVRRLEEKYLPEEEVARKYAESVGYQP